MIQTQKSDGRGGYVQLTPNDPDYWEGAYHYEPFPKALYKKTQPGQECEHRVVASQHEREKFGSDWHESPADAADAFDRREVEIARITAERNYSDTRMSAKAQAEALVADRATDDMLPAIPPRQPARRGRPRKDTVPDAQ